jgi:hypothetical protein
MPIESAARQLLASAYATVIAAGKCIRLQVSVFRAGRGKDGNLSLMRRT